MEEGGLYKGFKNVNNIECDVLLYAQQMNEDYMEHLKNNIVMELEGKCYRNYGYIKKIYAIVDKKKGIIIPENVQTSQAYKVTFSCLLYVPIVGKTIICRMDMLDDKLRTAINGPLEVVIPKNDINSNVFSITANNNVYIKTTHAVLKKGTFVKILIIKSMFSDRDTKIIVLGRLVDIPTHEEINDYYIDDKIVEDVIDENIV